MRNYIPHIFIFKYYQLNIMFYNLVIYIQAQMYIF
jgi:hypothetical protein